MLGIRKSYITYLFKKIKSDGPLFLLRAAVQYLLVYMGYRTTKSLAGPLNGSISLTYNCNLSCYMCDLPERFKTYEKDKERRRAEYHDFCRFIEDFRKIGTPSISFTGGEPLLYPKFFGLVKTVKQNGMLAQVTTNGWLVRKKINDIFESGLDVISISLDGATAEMHDSIREVPGSFDKAIDALKLLVEERRLRNSKLVILISSTFSERNYSHALPLVELARSLGVNAIGFMPLNYISPKLNGARPDIPFELRADIRKTIQELILLKKRDTLIETSVDYFNMFELCLMGEKLPIPCLASYTTFMIDAYGDYFPCHSFYQMERPWGNYFRTPLTQYWKGKDIGNSRAQIRPCRECFWNCQVETNLLYGRYRPGQKPSAPVMGSPLVDLN